MSTLLPVLAAIGLLDSASMIPIAAVPLAAILGGRRPISGALSFLTGIFLVYIGTGLLLLLGFDVLFDTLGSSVSRWWSQPNTPELLVQIAVGGVMIAFAWKLATARQRRARRDVPDAVSPGRGFVLGAGLTLVGMPGAFPYFGAVNQILRADLGPGTSAFALLFYNAIFLVPLTSLLLVRLLLPTRSEAIFQWVASFAERWGRHLMVSVLVLVGAVLFADGIGWFLGHPLLPVP